MSFQRGDSDTTTPRNRILIATPRSTISSIIQDEYYSKTATDLTYLISHYPQFAISLAKVIDSADIDKFSKAILEICYVNKTTMKLIYGLIRDEFSTNQVNTILRGNSLATKVETAFCRKVGGNYLKILFGDIILRLVTDLDLNLATTLNKLVDEDAKKGKKRIEENRQRILDVAQEVIDRFTSPDMVELMPREIRAIANFTSRFSQKYTPEMDFQFIGGFILLRFFNPAIITPESLNMLPPSIIPTPRDRQNLIAITRLLQKLSNNVRTNNAEEQSWVNPFIERNHQKISNYITNVCDDPLGRDFSDLLKEDPVFNYFGNDNIVLGDKHIEYIHNILFDHGSYLVSVLSKLPPLQAVNPNETVELCAEFLRLMLKVGPPKPSLLSSRRTLTSFSKEDTQWLPPQGLGEMIMARFGHTVAIMGSYAYFFGGSDVNGSAIINENSLVSCNLCTLQWSLLGQPSFPTRKYHSALFYADSMIIFGGVQNRESVNDMYEYNVNTKQWKKIEYANEPPLPRHGHSMNIINDDLYIFGGYCFDGKKYDYSNSLFKFNLVTRLWSEVESHNRPSERMYHSSFIHKNSIWIFGGKSNDMNGINDFYRYDISKKTWKKVSCRGEIPPSRWGHSLTLINDNTVILYGGNDEVNIFSDVYQFQFGSQTWRMINSVSSTGLKPPPLAQHSLIGYLGRIIICFGGTYTQTGTLSHEVYELILQRDYEPPNTLAKSMKQLINNPFMSDVVIIAEDQKIFAHKLVLKIRCVELYNSLKHSFEYYLPQNILYSHFYHFISFLYCNECNWDYLSFNMLLDMIDISYLFDCPDFSRMIELKVCEMVTTLNFSQIVLVFSVTEKYNLRALEVLCVKYLASKENVSEFPFALISNRLKALIAYQLFSNVST